MGALLGNVCYETNAQAVDAYYSGKEPSYTAGATSYLSYYEKVGANWKIVRKSVASNGTISNLTSSTAPVPAFPVCDARESFTDGIALGWLIVGLMVVAYGAVIVRRQIT